MVCRIDEARDVKGYRVLAMVLALAALAPPGAAQTDEPVALSLDEAIARGLEASHRVAEVTARGEAAAAVVEQRHAATLPRLSAQAGYTRTNHVDEFGVPLPGSQFRVIYPDVPDNYRSRLDAQWPVYTGGRLQALEQAASSEAAAADLDLAAARADLRLEIARAYWALRSAIASVGVLEDALTQADAHVRDAQNRLRSGLVPPNDVLAAEAQRSRQRMRHIQATARREVAEASLARLVGLAPGTPVVPTSLLETASLPPPAERFDDLLRAARDGRADRQAFAERVTTSGLREAAAGAGRRPTVALAAGVDLARPNPRIFPRGRTWRESWDASVMVDCGRARTEVAEAAAARRTAEARLREIDSLVALEIRQRLSEIESSRAAVAAADDAIAAAREARRVAAERFAAGVGTSTDVLDAQMVVLQAGLDRTEALAAWRTAEAGLARATGRSVGDR
jgi:outer membrane protein TolC